MSDRQTEYWDAVANARAFTHPIPAPELLGMLEPSDRILDYGCGYGRTCTELVSHGFRRIVGVDISSGMIARGRKSFPDLDLIHFDGVTLPFPNETFQAVFLLAVLTCIPSNAGQTAVIHEIERVLLPGGLLFLSDYPLQDDARNRRRYEQYEPEFGTYGVFKLSDGGVVRHLTGHQIRDLLSSFAVLHESETDVQTMNGNPARISQIVARKG